MLSKDARIAVKEGRLEIIAVKTFAEVFELSTGVALGIQSIYDERFEPGSALWIAKERIEGIKQSKRDQKKRSLSHRKVSEMWPYEFHYYWMSKCSFIQDASW